jgi:hypothetical protein
MACSQGGQTAAIFYPFGHPMPYAYGFSLVAERQSPATYGYILLYKKFEKHPDVNGYREWQASSVLNFDFYNNIEI